MKIGIPAALHYFYFDDLWISFFENLGLEVVVSKTNKDIVNRGTSIANDEMCLSLKVYIGHIDYLKDKCDYVFIPIINNFGLNDQLCANFLSLYDIVNNLFDVNILDCNIDYLNNKNELESYILIGKKLGFDKKKSKKAYELSKIKFNKKRKKKIVDNINKINKECTKILLVGHAYNLHDNYICENVIKNFKDLNCEIIYSDYFDDIVTNNLSKYLSKDLYWKYSKENIGSIVLCKDKVSGIVFLSSFPCGIDSLVNELVMHKLDVPFLNLVIDDLDASGGLVTRIESFVDILEQD